MYNNNEEINNNNNNNIDESQFVIERVEFALTSFYRPLNNDFSSLPQLQDWLMQFQRSFSAWSISPILLMSKTTEIQYFGASTIESKIKNSWLSLNSDMRVEFLDRLLLFLKNHIGNCLNIVVTRLCLAVSVIACHSTPDLWANPIMDIIQLSFQDLDSLDSFNPTMVNLTLELLTIFPEELTNSDYITQEKRNKVALQYNKHNSKVFEIISKIMTLPQNQQTTSYMKSSLKCLKSWIIFDCSPKEYLVESEIILKCFEAVSKNPLLVEDFLMVLDELFTFMGGKVFRSFPSSFNTILSKILVIFPSFYLMAIQEDNQIFNQIFLLFSHVAEYHIKLLLKSPELSKDFFKAFIQMAVKGDFETCELLAPVVTEIAALHETSNDGSGSNGGIDLSVWTQHLCEIVEVFRLKSMYPNDQEISLMSSEDTEKFTKFRLVAGDSTLEIYGILETQILQQLLNTLWTDMQSFSTTQNWQSIESTVFLLGCLSEGITESTEFIPQLFTILGHLPIQSTPLIKSTMLLAGKYSNLIDKSTQFLEKIVTDFFPAFQNPELKVVASQAFLSISKNLKCSQLLSTGIDQLISLCLPVLLKNNQIINDPPNFSIIEALLYIISVLPNNDILNYSTKLLSPFIYYIKDYKQSSTSTTSTSTTSTSLTTTQQSKHYQQQQQQPIPNELSLLLSSINLLTNFCKIYDDNHEASNNSSSSSSSSVNETEQQDSNINNKPVYQIINHIIPIYGDLLVQNNLESSIIEAISSFYKKAIIISSLSNCNNQSSSTRGTTSTTINIPEINRQLTIAFLKHKSLSMVLNSLSICIVNLPKEQPMDFLVESLSSISSKIIEIWKSNASVVVGGHSQLKKEIDNNNSMDNNNNSNSSLNEFLNFNISIYPDICKEYFSLLAQYIKYNVASIPKGVVSHLFSTILANITSIHDKVTARACFSFMSLVISKSKEMKDQIKWEPLLAEINNWLSIHGEFLVRQVLYCAGGGIPRGVIQFISDVIASLVSSYPEVFRLSALKNLLIDGFPSANISKAYKEKFVSTLMLYRSKKLPLKVIQDFSLVSLGISTESQNK